MPPVLRNSLVLAFVLLLPAIADACIWDYDTLKQERGRFPSTLELITGKFLRHSKEFYEWRIQDRIKKLATDSSNLPYYDDLAVAYEKTGQHAKAIETILAKEKLKPGLYETYSNLGTFHILAGDLELGLPYIDKALAINPDAHFGRERYQKWLVEYAIAQRRNGKLVFPLRSSYEEVRAGRSKDNFRDFVQMRLGKAKLTKADLQQAVKGILGMMRFANHANPLLLEALGDLLGPMHEPEIDAKRLSARAYLKASYEVQEKAAQDAFRTLAEEVLVFQTRDPSKEESINLSEIEVEFKAELADADRWYSDLREKEIGWIRAGKNADAEFDQLYTEEPAIPGEIGDEEGANAVILKVVIVAGLAAFLIVVILALRWARGPKRVGDVTGERED